jgi:hypothetical protein
MASQYDRYGRLIPTGQILSSVMAPLIVASIMFIAEYIYRASISVSLRFITVMDYTAQSSDGVVIISQDPSTANPIQLGTSVNERTGIEFAYSFFLQIKESTFTGGDELKHVFHRGYRTAWPLMCPGVFIKGDTNTMRVVVNTNRTPYKYADITNIPINKWFHVVLNCYKSGLDIYINSNLAHRIQFTNEVVYQNFEDILVFSPNIKNINNTITPAAGQPILFNGSASGNLSSMKYARYALSIKEINALMAAGPSSKLKAPASADTDTEYLSDTWWSSQQA